MPVVTPRELVRPVHHQPALPDGREPVDDAAPGRAAAFFDVDNTMMVGASMFHFAKGLAARDFFTWRDLARFAVKQARLRTSGENADDMLTARESALAFVCGKKVADIVALGEEIYDEQMADRIWAGTLELAQDHLDAGEPVWLVTATPVELAEIIARRLGLTGALGTVAETVGRRATPDTWSATSCTGRPRPRAVRALADRGGLGPRPLHGLLRLDQRRADAVAGGPPGRRQPRLGAAGGGTRARLGDPRLPHRAARPRASACPTALGVGVVGGGVAAGVALRRAHVRRAA